jgi:uncharacterized membrane protein
VKTLWVDILIGTLYLVAFLVLVPLGVAFLIHGEILDGVFTVLLGLMFGFYTFGMIQQHVKQGRTE